MTADYHIARSAGRCSVSDRELSPGEEFYTVLFETADGFQRRDVSAQCWEGPPDGAYCHFKSRVPEKAQRRRVFVDDATLIAFFLRLGESPDAAKLRLRFALSLILLRKRLLKYERSERAGGGEWWHMRLVRDKTEHRVFNPQLDEAQIEALTGELGVVLHGFVADSADDFELAPSQAPPDATAETADSDEPADVSPAGAMREGDAT